MFLKFCCDASYDGNTGHVGFGPFDVAHMRSVQSGAFRKDFLRIASRRS